jgi:hypothetical protein
VRWRERDRRGAEGQGALAALGYIALVLSDLLAGVVAGTLLVP